MTTWPSTIATLRDWLRDPMQLDDEGITPPYVEIIETAIALAEDLQRRRSPVCQVVPDGEGGISLDFCFSTPKPGSRICIWDDGVVEFLQFKPRGLYRKVLRGERAEQ